MGRPILLKKKTNKVEVLVKEGGGGGEELKFPYLNYMIEHTTKFDPNFFLP